MSQVYGYLRVSSIVQTEGDSLETQGKQIQAYATSKGWNVPIENIYVEAGVSGGIDFADRPEGAQLLSSVKSGDTIIFTKLDRAFRNVRNAFNTLYDLKHIGVNVHFLDLGGEVTGTVSAPSSLPSCLRSLRLKENALPPAFVKSSRCKRHRASTSVVAVPSVTK